LEVNDNYYHWDITKGDYIREETVNCSYVVLLQWMMKRKKQIYLVFALPIILFVLAKSIF